MTEKKLVSPFALYQTDGEKEREGVWLPIGPFEFKLARCGGGNVEFKKLASSKFKPYAAAIQNDTLPEDIANDITVEVFVKTVLKDWRRVGDEKGEPLPFTEENATALLTQLPDLFAEVREASLKVSNYRREALEAAAGN